MKTIKVPILHKVLIHAPREKVYDAITTAEGLDSWFTKGSIVNRKVGGTITFRWKNWGVDRINSEATGPIVEVKIPEKFIFKWWEDHYTTVEMDFKKVDEGTIVSVKEYGYKDDEEGHKRCLECATGWGEALTLLKFYLEYNIDTRI